ncbi:hypothetical protein PHYBOEH_008473 [Phytophthora boehmeriae]|uniref:Uncharacterized protein n=1 Tax=Phytophthora boehmeriae TaxID=109152 RepID=A0A8T1X6Z7_9STRA|nr:hypothetical protein PHYBOEH_008473 [Phytophthora boehmeriae]
MERSDTSGASNLRSHHTQESKTTSTSGRLLVFLATLVAAALPLSFVFYSINGGHARRSVYMLQICLSVGLLQKSWWHYRIRQRFMAPLEAAVAAMFGGDDPEMPRPDPTQYERMLVERMEPKSYAVEKFTKRWMKGVCGATLIATLVISVIVTAAITTIAKLCEPMVAVCVAVGSFSSMVCACFSPLPSDGVAILIHQGALTVTAVSTMIAHYTVSETTIQILDYLFVSLASWIILVISRIVASKRLLECSLMVALDTVALLHLTIIMMEFVDFVEHPLANKLPEDFAAFFVTVASAELGHAVFDLVVTKWMPRWYWRWAASRMYTAADFVISMLAGAIGTALWMLFMHTATMRVWHVVTLLGAAALSQIGRSLMTLIHETSLAPPWNHATFTVWNNGMMELINPFLIGWIAFHPYAKSILDAEGGY